jgi:hypothetical protein
MARWREALASRSRRRADIEDGGFVFTSSIGTPFGRENVTRQFQALLGEAEGRSRVAEAGRDQLTRTGSEGWWLGGNRTHNPQIRAVYAT